MIAQSLLRQKRRPQLPRELDRYPSNVRVDFRYCSIPTLKKYIKHFDIQAVNMDASQPELAMIVAKHYDKQLDACEEEILPSFVEYILAHSANSLEDIKKGPASQPTREKRTRKRSRRNGGFDSSDDEEPFGSRADERVSGRERSEKGSSDEIYCICRKPGYGEMIGCDNPSCQIEWFHVGCVGLEPGDLDRGDWYCPSCTKSMTANSDDIRQTRKRRGK